MTDEEYNAIFTKDKPIIFNFHGYPSLIHQLTYKRENRNLHVHGYNEEGTITTTFDIRVQNEIDRYHLVLLALKHLGYRNEDTIKLEEYCNKNSCNCGNPYPFGACDCSNDISKKEEEIISKYFNN